MVSCAMCGCSETKKNREHKISFHRFPKDQSTNQIWTNFVGKTDWIPSRYSVLCSLHFKEDCFDPNSNYSARRLNSNAIPTIEISRLKYVRNYNPIIATEVESDEPSTSVSEDAEDIYENITFIVTDEDLDEVNVQYTQVINREISTELSTSFSIEQAGDPKMKERKQRLKSVANSDILQRKTIRRLQQNNWRLRKRVANLSAELKELKQKMMNSTNCVEENV